MKKLLIIGGTVFVGRHITEAALAAGWEITLFHRGQSGTDLFPGVERILGDRNTDAAKLEFGQWDACIDVSGYTPTNMRGLLETLRDRVGHYVFISTISVYRDGPGDALDEDGPVLPDEGLQTEEVTGETYGPLKVRCERMVREAFGERATIIRPGLIIGPHDRTDRFSYWPMRFDREAVVLAASPDSIIQLIDGRDLAQLALKSIGHSGTYNATGSGVTWGEIVSVCQAATDNVSRVVWADPSWLTGQGVQEWTDLPLWVADPSAHRSLSDVPITRAQSIGLTHRSLEESVGDLLAWLRDGRGDAPLKVGMTTERQQELVKALEETPA